MIHQANKGGRIENVTGERYWGTFLENVLDVIYLTNMIEKFIAINRNNGFSDEGRGVIEKPTDDGRLLNRGYNAYSDNDENKGLFCESFRNTRSVSSVFLAIFVVVIVIVVSVVVVEVRFFARCE